VRRFENHCISILYQVVSRMRDVSAMDTEIVAHIYILFTFIYVLHVQYRMLICNIFYR